ncbi:methyl-accepting chemotaxis protein [Pelolinea submarina]|nr:methyl-accepting chemotaxis protein [Pelolinea submarina]
MYLVIGTIVLLLMGVWMFFTYKSKQLETVQTSIDSQLALLDFSLTNFITEVKNNVLALSENEIIRTQEDHDFTNFLEADEETFEYHIGDVEQNIIEILNTYRTTHPYVNSVYMGRENGSFVRSHPRNEPTQYDPRDRPWYILAKENPGTVMITEPYQSLTTSDINVGIVTALVDQTGEVYGVIGADVTLTNLTEFISGFDVGHSGQLLLVNEQGAILANKNSQLLFKNVQTMLGESSVEFMKEDHGIFTYGRNYCIYYTSPQLGWKIAAIIPITAINNEVKSQAAFPPLFSLFLTLILFGVLSSFGLATFVSSPLNKLNEVTQYIVDSGNLDQRVAIQSNDEIGELGLAFNEMVTKRGQVEKVLQQERDLANALGKANALLGSTLNLNEVLDRILEQVSQVIPNDSANVMLIKGDTAYITRSRGYSQYKLASLMARTTFKIADIPSLKRIYEQKKPIIVADAANFNGWVKIKGQEFLRSYAGAPIIIQDRVIGFLNVDSAKDNFYTEEHIRTLSTFAKHAAIAIDNAQLHEQVQNHATELKRQIEDATKEIHRRANELEALYQIGKDITSTLDLDMTLQRITDSAAEIVNADRSIIQLVDPESLQLINVMGCGYSDADLNEQSFEEFRECIYDLVLQERSDILSRDILKDERLQGKTLIHAEREKFKSIAIAPLEISDQIIGALAVIKKKGRRIFTNEDLDLISMLASQAASAIQNARLYEKAQEADRLKSAFLASMSHELRTPLNSIIGFTGILLQGMVGDLNVEQTKQLNMVQNSAKHLLELINDVLDISKIEAEQMNIFIEQFDLHTLIEKVVRSATPLAERKNLPLRMEISPKVGQISSDRRRVEQILINLLNNAIKFTDQGEVLLKSEVHDSIVEIHITDTGIGIKDEDLRLLFKPFQQVNTGLSRQYEGTGLGLAICKRLVEKLGGEISVDSEWGKGSTFTFSLPLDKQEEDNEIQHTNN